MKHIITRKLIAAVLCIAVLLSSALLLTSCGGDASDKLTYELNADKTGYIVTGCEKKNAKEITIPSEYNGLPVVEIADEAFKSSSGQGSLRTVVIPDSVTKIGNKAFYNCNISSLTLSQKIESIGESAFAGNGNMEKFDLPDTLTYLGADVLGAFHEAFTETENGVTYCGKWVISADKSAAKVTLRAGTVGCCR